MHIKTKVMPKKIIFVQKKIDNVYIESRPEEENGFDYDEDMTFDTIGDGTYSGLIPVSVLIEKLVELNSAGVNYVEIDYNCDHQEYEIAGYEFRQANEQEVEEYFQKQNRIEEDNTEYQIQLLEKQLEELKRKKK